MKYNELGDTGIEASRICLGSMIRRVQNTEAGVRENWITPWSKTLISSMATAGFSKDK